MVEIILIIIATINIVIRVIFLSRYRSNFSIYLDEIIESVRLLQKMIEDLTIDELKSVIGQLNLKKHDSDKGLINVDQLASVLNEAPPELAAEVLRGIDWYHASQVISKIRDMEAVGKFLYIPGQISIDENETNVDFIKEADIQPSEYDDEIKLTEDRMENDFIPPEAETIETKPLNFLRSSIKDVAQITILPDL